VQLAPALMVAAFAETDPPAKTMAKIIATKCPRVFMPSGYCREMEITSEFPLTTTETFTPL